MKKNKSFIIYKNGKYLYAGNGVYDWTDKNVATRFMNERKALETLQHFNIDGATLMPVYE